MKLEGFNLLADDGKTEVPIEDIHRFTVFHKTYENGLKIKAYVNPELCTVIDNEGNILKEGKYSDFQVYEKDIYLSNMGRSEKISKEIANGFLVLGKYNKCRPKLMAHLKKHGNSKQANAFVQTGQNSGYAITSNYMELHTATEAENEKDINGFKFNLC